MRAGVIPGRREFILREVDEPVVGPGLAVIDVRFCGICGSDVHAFVEGWPYSPSVCGHEWVGVVREVAGDVKSVSEGDVVAAGISPGCGACRWCKAALPQFCSTAWRAYDGPDAPANGGFARSMAVRANRLQRLPAALSDERGALVEPTSVALHGVRRSRLRPGDITCVVGCGPIGLLTIQCARVAGAGHIIAVEPDERRRGRAVAVGADVAFAPGAELREHIDEVSDRRRADIAFDCAGVPQTLQQSVDLVRRGGSVCMIGVAGGQAAVVPMRWLSKEVSVDTAMLFTLAEMEIAAGLILDGRVRATELHDRTVTLDELGPTIEALAERQLDAVKVLVDPSGG
jgi:threonine dehydrogenase-like Zn-dependent dehydrogenase